VRRRDSIIQELLIENRKNIQSPALPVTCRVEMHECKTCLQDFISSFSGSLNFNLNFLVI
jgi:hypothetical protein